MVVSNHQEVTSAVLSELERAPDPRFKEIMRALVVHLHAFARDARLTETEFHRAAAYVAKLGQMTNESDNEVIVMSGALGFSSLICLLNNGDNGQTETTANMLGPYWRNGSPIEPNGASIVRAPTPGDPVFVKAWIVDSHGRPVADAEVDVWHASTEGLYENQDPDQPDMNLRGRFKTDDQGRIWFRSVKPAGYGIPVSGPTGELLRAQGRHNMRPAHIHFLIYKPGFKTQFSQLYSHDCPYLETDVAFGVTRALVGHYARHENDPAPWGTGIAGPWYSLEQHFVIEAGTAKWPREPISGKATGDRPDAVMLPDERIGNGSNRTPAPMSAS